jgi:formylglycine-generating enzyme required for sulfatase activity/uncharacterized caspase-like protein
MSRNYAITIGINEYRYLQRLNYAKHDADAVRQLFLNELAFNGVYHFSDDSPAIPQDYGPDLDSRPSVTTLGRFLRTRFEKPFLRDGDNLWFFFAGHGVRSENRDYLMPLDGDRDDLEKSAIPIHYISECLRRSGADNIILLIDACRSEGKRDGFGVGTERQQGVITLFSCSPEESSYEIEELGQGAFTHVLLESLRRQGEGNCATVERLYQQLRHAVPHITRQYKRVPQTPSGVIEPPTKNHLILLPRSATLADITILKNDALRAEVQRDWQQAKRYWVRVLAASPADPEAIEGIERLAGVNIVHPPLIPEPYQASLRSAASLSSPEQTPPPVQPKYRVEQVVSPSLFPPSAPTVDFKVVTITQIEKTLLGFGSPKVITQTRSEKAEYRREDLGNGVTIDWVRIPGGTFTMGSSRNEQNRATAEGPQHEVTVPQFWMGKYQVTQAQYQAVMGNNPSRFLENGANRPVEQVSWDNAMAFCQKLSQQTEREFRLPSEAEWEYACRADSTTPFHFGPTLTPDLANYNGNYSYGSGPQGRDREQTTEVGSFPANTFGLYDMHGNVWEWCLDHWHDSYNGAPPDGSAWTTGGDNSLRVLRGGSWYSAPWRCRSAGRSRNARDGQDDGYGFRVVSAASWALS